MPNRKLQPFILTLTSSVFAAEEHGLLLAYSVALEQALPLTRGTVES